MPKRRNSEQHIPQTSQATGNRASGEGSEKIYYKTERKPKHKCLKIWPGACLLSSKGEEYLGEKALKTSKQCFFCFASPLCRANSCVTSQPGINLLG